LKSKLVKRSTQKVQIIPESYALEIMFEGVGNKPKLYKRCGSYTEVFVKRKVFIEKSEYIFEDSWSSPTRLLDENLKKSL